MFLLVYYVKGLDYNAVKCWETRERMWWLERLGEQLKKESGE